MMDQKQKEELKERYKATLRLRERHLLDNAARAAPVLRFNRRLLDERGIPHDYP